jgi:hypothetical protein
LPDRTFAYKLENPLQFKRQIKGRQSATARVLKAAMQGVGKVTWVMKRRSTSAK